VEKMKLILVLLALTGSALAASHDPVDSFIDGATNKRPEMRLQTFAKSCGTEIEGVPVYGLNLGRGLRISSNVNVANRVKNPHIDYLEAAALWNGTNHTHIIDVWDIDLDEGKESNLLFCISSAGNVLELQVINVMLMTDVAPGWCYEITRRYSSRNQVVGEAKRFIDIHGVTAPSQNIDGDKEFAEAVPNLSVAADVLKALEKEK
jgi:hypothetical protein